MKNKTNIISFVAIAFVLALSYYTVFGIKKNVIDVAKGATVEPFWFWRKKITENTIDGMLDDFTCIKDEYTYINNIDNPTERAGHKISRVCKLKISYVVKSKTYYLYVTDKSNSIWMRGQPIKVKYQIKNPTQAEMV